MIFGITLSELLLVSVILLVVVVLLRNRRKTRLPPGPWALPLLGNVLQLDIRKPYNTLIKWGKRYGPIYRMKMGLDDTIVLSDVALLRELFSDNVSSGRTSNPIILQVTKGAFGVFNTDGHQWDVTRRFTIRTLRELGFAKNSMEGMILEELRPVLQMFREKEATPISGTRIFNAPVVNALWHIVTGGRCQWEIPGQEPPVLDAAMKVIEGFVNATSRGLFFAPSIRFIAPQLTGWRELVAASDLLENLFLETVEEHKAKLDIENPKLVIDFIDHVLKEISETSDPESCFYKELGCRNLVALLFDLFLAGMETTSSTLSWILLYVANTQSAQRKLQEEIERIIGTSRLPSLSDRQNMPYTEAVLSESLRLSAITPLGNPHRMMADKEFHGYLLPKDSLILVNVYGIQTDPKYWGDDPLAFRPERFLSEDQTKLKRSDALIPFSVGKRACLGEGLARDTLFLFVASIFQQFNINPDEKCSNSEFESEGGLVRHSSHFKFIATSRNA